MPRPTLLPHTERQNPELAALLYHDLINAGGTIPFSHFVHHALHHPTLGYYCTHSPFGPKGDFVTAPELSPLFARCIAETFKQIGGDIVEYGAGSGVFARDLLTALAADHALPDTYWIIESSPALRAEQAALLTAACPEWIERIKWPDTPPTDVHGMIFANEVLDALPFDCFQYQEGKFWERHVGWKDDQWHWQLKPPSDRLKPHFATLPPLPEGYRSEIRPQLPLFIKEIASHLRQGLLLLIDYGYGRNMYFNPQRHSGTLSCFYRHYHHSDPFILLGLQDITAHVDFTSVAEGATAAGLALTGFTTQAAFLLGSGLPALAEPKAEDSAETIWHQAQVIKRLTQPDEMGETVKAIGFSPNPDLLLPGFSFKDYRHDL